MNVRWIFPDRTTRETTVPHVHQLLFVLEVVDAVCLDGVAYRTERTELVVEGERCFVAIVLANASPGTERKRP